ncbi:MAG: alpha/beta hydrolase [Bacteroidota bacterium]
MVRKRILRWGRWIGAIYLLIGLLFYIFQDRLFFHPERVHPAGSYQIPYRHAELAITLNESDTLHLIDFAPDSNTSFRGIVLYFHGNRKHIGYYADQTPPMTKAGYRVLMIDYPGYGRSSGTLTEKKLYDWSEIVYRIAHKQVSADSILIYGKSLGTGVATRLASIRSCKSLILETPYFDLPTVAARFMPIYPTHWLMNYQFPLHEYLSLVKAPVFIFHGTDDEVIGLKQALRLRALLKPNDQFLIVPGGTHNGLTRYVPVRKKLDSVWNTP